MKKLVLALVFLLSAWPAVAQEDQYGYVVGTLDPTKSFLEKTDPVSKGKYLHYHIFLRTDANVEYTVVIDVNDVSPTTPLIYRLASLDGQTSAELTANFGPVFAASGDFHLISNQDPAYGPVVTPTESQRRAAGALDYERHPGILKAIQGQPWQRMFAKPTADPLQWELPLLDNLFKPFTSPFFLVHVWTKVYVFGAPFTLGGNGMHVVHQNQADTGTTYSGKNATWQDGAVIIERHVSFGIDGPPHVYRTVLMTKFANQTDFSAESNDVAHPAPAGHALAPAVQTIPLGLINHDVRTFGPFYASQLEVSTSSTGAYPSGPGSAPRIEVAVKNGAFTSDADPGDSMSTDYAYAANTADYNYRAFGRGYAPLAVWYNFRTGRFFNLRSPYYVRVRCLDSGGDGFGAASTMLSVSSY